MDESGHIVRSLHDQGGEVTTSVSHVLDLGDSLVIGSYHAPFVLKVDLEDMQ